MRRSLPPSPRMVPALLVCVAVYSLADAVNVTFSFALRGAGDTRFVHCWHVRSGLADHGRADLPGRPRRRQHLLGLVVSRRRTSSPWRSASTSGSERASGRRCA